MSEKLISIKKVGRIWEKTCLLSHKLFAVDFQRIPSELEEDSFEDLRKDFYEHEWFLQKRLLGAFGDLCSINVVIILIAAYLRVNSHADISLGVKRSQRMRSHILDLFVAIKLLISVLLLPLSIFKEVYEVNC